MREFRWQILARWVMAGVLALWAVIAGSQHYLDSVVPLFAVVASVLLYNVIISATPLLKHWPYQVTWLSQLLDICALTLYLHFSGDLENPLTLAYTIPVVSGTVIGSRRAGMLLATISSLLFLLLVSATLVDAFPFTLKHHHLNLVPGLHLTETVDPDLTNQGWGYILTHWSGLTAILLGSAYGFGTLSERIREKETALKVENERVQLLLGILPEGVVLLDPTGRIVLNNVAARALVGAREGLSIAALDPRLGISERLASFTEHYAEFEISFRERVLNHVLARRAPDGPTVWVIRDLTEQHRLMAELMHRSKMADLGMLGAGIAHEIGNPLSSISAILQLIEMRQAAPDITERIKAARSHVDRMSRILQDMRDFARPSTGVRRPIPVEELLDKALQIVHLHEKTREMEINVAPVTERLRVVAVEDQIVQVLLNILLNAADASGRTGRIEVTARRRDDQVAIAIHDAGSGMSREVQERLFLPFFTTKAPRQGVGLGLFLSESIVRAHGGRIQVHSVVGEGSTFTIFLPHSSEET